VTVLYPVVNAGVETAPAPATPVTLAASFDACRRLHRLHGTTYYWATMALLRMVRPYVHALYGLCRYADEIVDAFDDVAVSQRRYRLNELRKQLRRDLRVGDSDHDVLKAVVFTARAFALPTSAFERFFDSMESDLEVSRYDTYADLERYMDGSAAVIGELMLPILDPTDTDAAFGGARDLGVAFQLTNLLRDVGEDLDRGRVYFPLDELAHFGVDIESRRVDDAWADFCCFQIDRMQVLYRRADEAITYLPPSSAGSIRAARVLRPDPRPYRRQRIRRLFAQSACADRTEAARRRRRMARGTENAVRPAGQIDDAVIVVDQHDRATGSCAKLEAHRAPGVRHRAFSAMVFYADGRWLLQRRAATKYHFGGRWTNSCCSHPRPGGTLVAAVVHPIGEALGLVADVITAHGAFEYRATDSQSGLVEHEIDHVFSVQTTGLLAFDRNEISACTWRAPRQVADALEHDPSRFTPWLAPVVEMLSTSLLRAAS